MQIKETTNDGLKRAFAITIPASEIEGRVEQEVRKIAPQIKMPGFRPGKVPANLVRKMHGEQLHAQAVNDVIRESVDKVMTDNALRPAMQPKVEMGEGYEAGKDATLTMELEVLPQVEAPDLEGLKLERLTVPVDEAQVDETLQRIAGQNKSYSDAGDGHSAQDGDQLIIDFVGRVDGEEFEGGKAEGAPLVLGSGQFIPGFEEQLGGVKPGDTRTISVTFPEDYQAKHLAGKAAEFDVTVQAVKIESETSLDDDFAKNLGLESLDKLRELVRGQLEQETAGLTRTQMKRALLDQLAAGHDFAVPQGMVDAEFDQIWSQLQQEASRSDDPEAMHQEMEAEKDDYRRIAERRVRLGLLLSEIGQKNNVQVTSNEMSMLIQQAAQQYRQEDRQRFVQYIQQEPMAAAQLRAPLYEDKVVDFLFDKAEITDREVTREELEAAIEADEDTGAAAQGAKPADKKKGAKAKDGDKAKEPATKKGKAKPAEETSADDKPKAKKKSAKNADAPAAEGEPAKKAKAAPKAKADKAAKPAKAAKSEG
ncbi:trigger factor [Qipengyuania sp.]|uniref:trigger factor n=1 Tax=Qipengyuania sp. TaxID=2004515 RepID=UPI0037365B14